MTVRRVLGWRLREIRGAARFSVENAAHRVGLAPEQLTDAEAGRLPLAMRQIICLCEVYGLDDLADRIVLLTLARLSLQRGWWDDYADVLTADGSCTATASLWCGRSSTRWRCCAPSAAPR